MSKKVAKKATRAEPRDKQRAKTKGSRKAAPENVAEDKSAREAGRPEAPVVDPVASESAGPDHKNRAGKRRVTVSIDETVKQEGETSAAKGSSKRRTAATGKPAAPAPRETAHQALSTDDAPAEPVGFANSPFAADLEESGDEPARGRTGKKSKAAKKADVKAASGDRQKASRATPDAAKPPRPKPASERGKKRGPSEAGAGDAAAEILEATTDVNMGHDPVVGETQPNPGATKRNRDAQRGKKPPRAKARKTDEPEVDGQPSSAAHSHESDAPATPAAREKIAVEQAPSRSKRKKNSPVSQPDTPEASQPVDEAVIDPAAEEALELERNSAPEVEGSAEADPGEDEDEEDEAAILVLNDETREDEDGEELTEEEENQRYLKGIIEALLFASDKPLTGRELARAARIDKKRTVQLLAELRKEYRHRGVNIVEVSGGFVLRSNPAYGAFVQKALALRPVKLSRAQLETLAIVAYRQPITRPEIDDIRGVDSGQVLKGLADRDLIKMVGKKDEAGRPMLYGTTDAFLELFSLESLKGLPNLREFTELSDDSREKFTAVTGETIPGPAVLSEDEAAGDSGSEAGAVGSDEEGAVGSDEEGSLTVSESSEALSEVEEVDDASADAQDAEESLDAQDADESLDVTMGAELLEDAAPIAELDDQDASSTTGAPPELVDAPAEDEIVSAPVPTPYFDEGDDVEAGLVNDETDELR